MDIQIYMNVILLCNFPEPTHTHTHTHIHLSESGKSRTH